MDPTTALGGKTAPDAFLTLTDAEKQFLRFTPRFALQTRVLALLTRRGLDFDADDVNALYNECRDYLAALEP